MTEEKELEKAREILTKLIKKVGNYTDAGFIEDLVRTKSYYRILFSHDVAKKIWPGVTEGQTEWRYHLQQMVLQENPLDYIAKFLKK